MRFVRTTIARHAGRPASALHPGDNLENDLDLTPLELVLIAIEVEEAAGIDIPVEGLASLETLGELMRFFSRALSRARRSGAFRSVA
jgi:acyl carrier protein